MKKIDIFHSNLWYFDIQIYFDLKENLLQEIYALKNKYETVSLTNRGGWQSQSVYTIENYRSNNLKILMHKIVRTIEDGILIPRHTISIDSLWYNVNTPGSHNDTHNHPNCDLAGVFYMKVPEDRENCGTLVLENDHIFTEYKYQLSINPEHRSFYHGIEPIEGRFYMFPSHIKHRVLTNETDEDRISFACNMTIQSKI